MEKPNLMSIATKIDNAEKSLGELSHGQLRDLLLDNFDCILDCAHADRILIMLGR